jgi:pimeloyl-ACP methyl ester carboxylesterase
VPYAEINGTRLFHDERGEGDPLICVQGLASDHGAWGLQLDAFAERFRTIVFDNRDVGRSDPCEEDYDVADIGSDVLALADHLELDRFHLLGASLGSAACQHAALAQPDRIRTLTLVATWAGTSHAYSELRARVWEREVRRCTREELLEHVLLRTISEDVIQDDETIDALKQMALENPHPQPADALIRQIRAMERHDVRDRIGELHMPVHVIAGDRDVLIPLWKSEEVAQLIHGSTLTRLRGTGHALNAERVEEFNRAVVDFLTASNAPR